MKTCICFVLAIGCAIGLQAQKGTSFEKQIEKIKSTPVAVVKGDSYRVLTQNLSRKTPSGYRITKFRIIHSKDRKTSYLVQEFKHPKSGIYRYLRLEKRGNEYFLSVERDNNFVDCWLMPCSTCEEVVSQTGGVWCECSVGGCSQKDTSDTWRDILEKVYAY